MSKSETNPNPKLEKENEEAWFWTFAFSDFGFVSDFDIRISDFLLQRAPCRLSSIFR
jgi:hypothetical protein